MALLDLPSELLLQIISDIDPYTTFVALRVTCRRFHAICTTYHPTLIRLTPSIWIKIFEYLPKYFHVRNVAQTCHSFEKLLHNAKSTRIRNATFTHRRVAPGRARASRDFDENGDTSRYPQYTSQGRISTIRTRLHPCLEMEKVHIYALWTRGHQSKSLRFQFTSGPTITESKVVGENATSPPTSRVVIEYPLSAPILYGSIILSRESHGSVQAQPIKVIDVLNGYRILLSQPLTKDENNHTNGNIFCGRKALDGMLKNMSKLPTAWRGKASRNVLWDHTMREFDSGDGVYLRIVEESQDAIYLELHCFFVNDTP